MKLPPLPYQINKAKTMIRKLRLYGLVQFAGQVRSGKTAAFIYAAKALANDEDILIITKKAAIEGVQKFTDTIMVTNFHQVKKVNKRYKVVIIDECHRYITSFPKTSTIWQDISQVTHKASYIIFSSGTPTPENYAMLFNMLALSLESPWNTYIKKGNKTAFSSWHKVYGIPYEKSIGWDDRKKQPIFVKGWDQVNESKIKKSITHLQVSLTQQEAGHKYLATNKVHEIPLSDEQKELYAVLDKDKLYELEDDYTILGDTPAKLNAKKHQISGGFVKATYDIDESQTKVHTLKTIPKIEYIKKHFNPEDTIIVSYYIPEQEYLAKVFPHTASITKNSDGVDYSLYKYMIIYSMDFSASTYQQIIGRQLNFKTRKEPIVIHFLLSGIDTDVYRAVAVDKKTFTSSWYKNR